MKTLLWIDFKLYFYVRIHKLLASVYSWFGVVNWFQIVFLRENSQVWHRKVWMFISCELISNCIFTWEFTSVISEFAQFLWLWIDFKLYFYVRIHKTCLNRCLYQFVVNWFQIVFLRENSQGKISTSPHILCCELISNCIFTWEFTRNDYTLILVVELWIDFKLYFYVRIHKFRLFLPSK